jgi:hypothetical protein
MLMKALCFTAYVVVINQYSFRISSIHSGTLYTLLIFSEYFFAKSNLLLFVLKKLSNDSCLLGDKSKEKYVASSVGSLFLL